MTVKNGSFGVLFKEFRLRSGLSTLREFGDILAQKGLVYDDSLFSHWQKGDKMPMDRRVILMILKIFIEKGGVSTVEEVNRLLESAGHGYLTEKETQELSTIFKNKEIAFNEGLITENKLDLVVEDLSGRHNVLEFFEEQAGLAYEKIYEGYPHIIYKYLRKLKKAFTTLKLDKSKLGKNILSRISWIRLRCLSDIVEPKDFLKAYQQTLVYLQWNKEADVFQLGPLYWMVAAIKRLEIITCLKKSFASQKEVEECRDIARLALVYTSRTNFAERLVEHLELAKIALLLKDNNDFNQQMDMAFSYAIRLPPEKKYLETMVWDVLARGNLGLENNTLVALENIRKGKKAGNNRYQAINLFLKNTEYQALISTKDQKMFALAKKLQNQLRLETALLDNPYQKLRLRQKKFIGL